MTTAPIWLETPMRTPGLRRRISGIPNHPAGRCVAISHWDDDGEPRGRMLITEAYAPIVRRALDALPVQRFTEIGCWQIPDGPTVVVSVTTRPAIVLTKVTATRRKVTLLDGEQIDALRAGLDWLAALTPTNATKETRR